MKNMIAYIVVDSDGQILDGYFDKTIAEAVKIQFDKNSKGPFSLNDVWYNVIALDIKG
jgi:hypothetical protein